MYDYPEVLQDIQEIVAEHGADHVYVRPENSDMCMYMHGDKPGCIVGHWMVKNGIQVLPDFEGNDVYGLRHRGVSLSDNAANFLNQLQMRQDNGNTWGEALRRAKLAIGDHS